MLDTALIGVPVWLILLIVAGAVIALMFLTGKQGEEQDKIPKNEGAKVTQQQPTQHEEKPKRVEPKKAAAPPPADRAPAPEQDGQEKVTIKAAELTEE